MLLPSTEMKRRPYNQSEEVLQSWDVHKNYASNIVVSERDSFIRHSYLTSWGKEKSKNYLCGEYSGQFQRHKKI